DHPPPDPATSRHPGREDTRSRQRSIRMETPMAADPRLIVALDYADSDDARRLVELLDDQVAFYKIGLTLLARGDGVALAHALKAAGKQVFQDWKLHDIGAQVEG